MAKWQNDNIIVFFGLYISDKITSGPVMFIGNFSNFYPIPWGDFESVYNPPNKITI